jgi:hypothetical protein
MATQNDTPAVNPAEIPVYEAGALYHVPIDRVREDPDQPRKSFDAQGLEEMVASVVDSMKNANDPTVWRIHYE